MKEHLDISKYLRFLEEDGWSELIDTRWADEVRDALIQKFPDMTDAEWKQISKVVFW